MRSRRRCARAGSSGRRRTSRGRRPDASSHRNLRSDARYQPPPGKQHKHNIYIYIYITQNQNQSSRAVPRTDGVVEVADELEPKHPAACKNPTEVGSAGCQQAGHGVGWAQGGGAPRS